MISFLGGSPIVIIFSLIYNLLIIYFILRIIKFFREKIELDKEKIALEKENNQYLLEIIAYLKDKTKRDV
jgi:hypothetical protein